MAEGKTSFVLYVDSKETWEELTDEQAGKLIKHIYKYVSDENPEMNDPLLKIAFLPIKQQLKRDLKRWESKQKQRSEAGKRSAELRASKAKETEQKPTTVESRSTNPTVSDSVNGSVNVNEINIKFSEFWELYDKKRGDKEKIKVKWEKLTEVDREKVIDYIPKYKLSQPDKQYRKDPVTFLNQKSWNDELLGDKCHKIEQEKNLPSRLQGMVY